METHNRRAAAAQYPWHGARAPAFVLALAFGLALACSSGSTPAPPTLRVTPGEATVAAGAPATQFTATLSNSSAPIAWSIDTAGGASEVGTVSGGLYTPPPSLTGARDVVVKAAAGGLAARAIVHVAPNAAVPPEPDPEPELVVTANAPITVNLLDASTVPPTPITVGFRWLIEENAMRDPTPGAAAVAGVSPSLSLHPSYMPAVASGRDGYSITSSRLPYAVTLDPGKRYFVSVLPDSGYQMGGADLAPGATSVTVSLQPQSIPTALITILAFEDNFPINNAPDVSEHGLPGFMVLVIEAGGTYGASGGQVMQDAFGNPIGTEYQKDASGNPVLVGGEPVVQSVGTGVVLTDANGLATVKYLPPGKYGIQLIPPAGQDWHQTTTIEGTKTIDAWVKAKEPPFLQEFGPVMQHVFMGFVKAFADSTVLGGGATVNGRVVNVHNSRPPALQVFAGDPMPDCWIGLNDLAGSGRGVYAQPCNVDSTFAIPNVPPGVYQLVVWDEFLDVIIAFSAVSVPAGAAEVQLGDVAVNSWFARMEGKVCLDMAPENGFCDPGEVGIQDQAVNLRFRDGSIYQVTATNELGEYEFREIFPFFNWLIAEVDFLRFKATGATVVVDDGGAIQPDDGWNLPSRGKLTPQPQYQLDANGFATGGPEISPITGNNLSRTETGPVLLEGFQGFAGLTNVIDWGKAVYSLGENGGITGIVHYASTRAEDDPRYAAADNWEPKIPRVPVFLYRDCDGDGKIDTSDPLDPQSCTSLSSGGHVAVLGDVDNWPFGWSDGSGQKGPEDVERSTLGVAGLFDKGDAYDLAWTDSFDDVPPTGCQYPGGVPFTAGGVAVDCFEGMPNFSQVRPTVFDGGYAFGSAAGKDELPAGAYVVEAVTPPGYEHVKEEDKNVTYGDTYQPSPLLLPPPCVGPRRIVPAALTIFPEEPTKFGGAITNLCDRKQVEVKQGENAAADFFMFTAVPVTAHIVALVTDDLNNGTNPASPFFGEKLTMGWIPVSIHDWTGVEIGRTYTDQWGIAQALVPSTFSANVPMPSGYSPNVLRWCVNSPGHFDANGQWVADPRFNPAHSHTCYSFQFMPGKTTYLDTPVIPVAAFATQREFPVDCELQDGTPVIASVQGGPVVALGATFTVTSAGPTSVPNPLFNGTNAATIVRDLGFGGGGTVTLDGTALTVQSWTPSAITVTAPAGATTGQLHVERADTQARTVVGVTLTVTGTAPAATVGPGQSIQAAIDQAQDGDLVLVLPGVYRELLFLTKSVRLQGSGASTVIDGLKSLTGDELETWRASLGARVAAGAFDLLPGQSQGPALLALEQGPALFVAGKSAAPLDGARVDGFTITGASDGGAILVNGHAHGLQISNNRIVSNAGTYGGGIRVGHPLLVSGTGYVDADNDGVSILGNQVALNGGTAGAGGIALAPGADGYRVEENFVCGNFSNGDGGGIGHFGLSANATIARNTVILNQSYQQGQLSEGGGIFVGGQPSLVAGQLSAGTGSVSILANLVQGNHAATGDGGGIRLQFVNGQDVLAAPGDPASWYTATLENNVIVNNVAGNAGGGISLQDVARARIVNNTVAHNDSTGTSIAAFAAGSPNQSSPQPAGIVSWVHSGALGNALPGQASYSNPELTNNIIWQNRSFYWTIDVAAQTQGLVRYVSGGLPYWDLAVLGALGAQLDPQFCLVTDPTLYPAASNVTGDPQFASPYFNGDRAGTPGSTMTTFATFDEGGNFLSVEYGPLTPTGDYHIGGGPANGTGNGAGAPDTDFDGDPRGANPDIGADEN
jgi:hypothetical protein